MAGLMAPAGCSAGAGTQPRGHSAHTLAQLRAHTNTTRGLARKHTARRSDLGTSAPEKEPDFFTRSLAPRVALRAACQSLPAPNSGAEGRTQRLLTWIRAPLSSPSLSSCLNSTVTALSQSTAAISTSVVLFM